MLMTEPFIRVEVTSDTPEWETERRHSIGASEVAAVLGLSSYGVTPLDVYKSKQGVDRPFDPVLGFIGHESESIIEKYLTRFTGLDLDLRPGFMARSAEWPWLHASFDRVAADPFLTVQMKTAHHYAGHHWDDGVPTDIRVQVQAEMAVAGTGRALVVVWIGGREFRHFWEPRDDAFIRDHLVPKTRDFWDGNVRALVPPPVSTVAEVNALPTDRDLHVDLSDEAFEVLERRTVLRADIKSMEDEADALTVALAQYTGTADVLLHNGRKVATWRQQKGRTGFDLQGFRNVHPDLAAEFTTQGQPFRVLRATKARSS